MAYNPLPPLGQDDMAGSLPVVIASDQSAVPVTVSGVSTAAKQDTGNTSLATLAGAVAGTEVQVDVLTMPTTAVTNAGLTALNGAISGTEVQVDVLTMPTVTVTATNLDVQSGGADLATTTQAGAIQTSVELMDDTVTAQGTALGTTKTILNGASVTTAAPTYTTGQISPLNLATTGALRVDVGATSANATAIKVNVASGGIAAGAIAAGATSIATTEDTASAAADHLVKVAAIRLDTPVANANVSNSGDYTQFALDNKQKLWTADNQIEDDAHATGDRGSFMLGVRVDTPNTASSGADADYTGVAVNKVGSLRTALLEDDFAVVGSNHVKKYYTNSGAVTDGIVWSPAAGKRWYVTDIFINTSAAATITLEDDLTAGDAAVWKAELAANSGWSHHFGTPLFSGEDAADLLITTSAGNCYVTCVGYEI